MVTKLQHVREQLQVLVLLQHVFPIVCGTKVVVSLSQGVHAIQLDKNLEYHRFEKQLLFELLQKIPLCLF